MKTNKGIASIFLALIVFVGIIAVSAVYRASTKSNLVQPEPAVKKNVIKENPEQNKKPAPIPIENKKPVLKNDCVAGGCSGQLCYDPKIDQGNTTCEFLPKYACYRNAECKRQTDGKCGWTQTSELKSCITNAQGSNNFSCIFWAPPAPGWCSGGTIVPSPNDEHGCAVPATCKINNYNFLKQIIKSFGGIITECELDGDKAYISDDSYADGSLEYFYNNNSTPFLSCGSGNAINPPPGLIRCRTIDEELKGCRVIYSTLPENKVDVYNLSNNLQ